MKEPTASAIAAASGVTILSGTVLGLPAEALLAGFAGGLVALSYGDPMTWGRKAGSVAVSTLSAAFLAPGVMHVVPMPVGTESPVWLKFVAFCVGLGAQRAIPALMDSIPAMIARITGAPAKAASVKKDEEPTQ